MLGPAPSSLIPVPSIPQAAPRRGPDRAERNRRFSSSGALAYKKRPAG